jgi:hypothetical protein
MNALRAAPQGLHLMHVHARPKGWHTFAHDKRMHIMATLSQRWRQMHELTGEILVNK